MSWRYFATRLNGDGTETFLGDLPLSEPSVTYTKNQPTDLGGLIAPEYKYLQMGDEVSLLDKWSTAIYFEEDGHSLTGGILVDDMIDPETGSLELVVMGFSGYPNGQPYMEKNSWPPNPYPTGGIEPMDALREIWRHLQDQPRGDLGVTVDSTNIGKKIGKMVAQGEYDTENGPLSFEYEPFMLRDFETFDLAEPIRKLVEGVPLDFVEEVSWADDGETILKHIRVGYPRLGARREDYRFVMGENVQFSQIDPPDDEYADVILGLGAGEGTAMIRGTAYRSNEHRIRRARAYEDKTAKTPQAINVAAQRELRAHIGVDEVTSITALPNHVDELVGLQPGDEVRLLGETPHRPVDMWVVIQSKTRSPETGGLEFAVTRSDRLAG